MVAADAQTPNYQQPEQSTQPQAGMSLPTTMDANQYRRDSTQLVGPPITQAQYSASNFSAQQLPQYSQYSHYGTGYHSQQHFHAPYQQQHQQQQQANHQTPRAGIPQPIQPPFRQTYTPISSATQQYIPPTGSITQSQSEPGDNSDGGVPVGTTY